MGTRGPKPLPREVLERRGSDRQYKAKPASISNDVLQRYSYLKTLWETKRESLPVAQVISLHRELSRIEEMIDSVKETSDDRLDLFG